MFSKKKCERCGKEYKMRTISENRGKHYCRDCVGSCLICGKKLPRSNYFGETSSISTALFGSRGDIQAESSLKPWIGSGKCNECYWKEQELLKEAQLRQAKEILETPTVWKCEYCKMDNRGKFCSNCGSPRR